jgi:DNA-directed RNA polymerase specialized sigma24 family protein
METLRVPLCPLCLSGSKNRTNVQKNCTNTSSRFHYPTRHTNMQPLYDEQELARVLQHRSLMDVCNALAFIPPESRNIFILRYANGQSLMETALGLNLPESQIEIMEKEALKIFIDELNKIEPAFKKTPLTL